MITTQESGGTGQTDQEQLAYAVKTERTLLTHNRVDFETLATEYVSEKRMHYGIIIATRRPPHQLVQRLLQLIDHFTADEMKDRVLYV